MDSVQPKEVEQQCYTVKTPKIGLGFTKVPTRITSEGKEKEITTQDISTEVLEESKAV